jgi:hypothetical protein
MRREDKSVPLDRRTFFKNVARWSLAGGMAAAAVVAWRRRPISEPACVNEGVCRGCPAYTGCGLPQALSAKKVLGSGNSNTSFNGEART